MLFQCILEPLVGTKGVDFDIPLYSKTFLRPLRVRRVSIPIWYSMLFQGIPETLVGTKGVKFYIIFHDRPSYSKAFESLVSTEGVDFSTIFHVIPCYSKACPGHSRAPILWNFPRSSTIFHGIPRHAMCRAPIPFFVDIPKYSMLFQGMAFYVVNGTASQQPGKVILPKISLAGN